MKKVFSIHGMQCASCARGIEKTLQKVNGVSKVNVNFNTENLILRYDEDIVDIKNIASLLKEMGYHIMDIDHPNMHHDIKGHEQHNHQHDIEDKFFRLKLVIAIILSFFLMILSIAPIIGIGKYLEVLMPDKINGWTQLILASIVLFWSGDYIWKSSFKSLIHGIFDMNLLISIGTGSAYIISLISLFFPEFFLKIGSDLPMYFEVAGVIITFVMLGKYWEQNSKHKTQEGLKQLFSLQTNYANILKDGVEKRISIDQIKIDDIVIVKTGEKISVDGIVLAGEASVDESWLTGESIPKNKKSGDSVFSGSMNLNGYLQIKVHVEQSNTILSQTVRLVQEAVNQKPGIQNLADKLSSIFVPSVILIAIVTFLVWIAFGSEHKFNYALLSAISVLVVACPCAVGLAIPTAIAVAVGKGAQNGILIKNPDVFQKFKKLNTIIFDKTGTLTEGKPQVTDLIFLDNNLDKDYLISLFVSLESRSSHPLAKAIIRYFNQELSDIEINNFEEIKGKGLKASIGKEKKKVIIGSLGYLRELGISYGDSKIYSLLDGGKTVIGMSMDQQLVLVVGMFDQVRSTSKKMIEFLKNKGLEIVLLSGDNKKVVENVADELGIQEYYGEVHPQDKYIKVEFYQKERKIVAMVGDGINDAPALALANIGIAMGTGTDIAMSAGDIVLIGGDMNKIKDIYNLSITSYNIMIQNLFWAFFYNVILIPLAAGGMYLLFGILLSPIFASIAMALSSVSVVLNSLRINR